MRAVHALFSLLRLELQDARLFLLVLVYERFLLSLVVCYHLLKRLQREVVSL